MIKFFRKIRQQLLSENRLTRYLLYAIGEIFLVVLGILIALQVNNWNEERKMQALKRTYKLALIEDLKKDTTELKQAINSTETELNYLSKISEEISTQPLNVDSIIHLYRFEFSPLIDASRDFNRNTIESLLSTGHINLFQKDLHKSLMNLNALQGKTIKDIETELGFYMNFFTEVHLIPVDQFNGFRGLALETVWKNIDRDEFLRDFSSILTSKIMAYKFNLDSRKSLLNETESVLKLLNE